MWRIAANRGVVPRRVVDRPRGVEDLVATVFRVRLREHHQLGIGGITAELAVQIVEVLHLVVRKSEAEALVCARKLGQRNATDGGGGSLVEQGLGARGGLRHAIVQERRKVRHVSGRDAFEDPLGAAFQARHDLPETHRVGHFGGLGRPRRLGSDARGDEEVNLVVVRRHLFDLSE